MVSLVKLNNSAVKFVFTDSDHYLTGNGEIEVPVNSLSLVLDESEMVNFKKAANGDPFISFIASDSNLGTKAAIEQFYKENMVGGNSGGGGGSGVTPSEVQSMIDQSLENYYTDDEVDAALSGKASASDVTALENEVATKADTSALTAVANDVSTLSGTVDDINDAIAELDDKEQVIASALTQMRDDMDEKEEVIATALNDLNEAIGDSYQKVSGLTIEADEEENFPFIRIEAVEGSNSNYTYINDVGLESTVENNTEGSNYSSYIGQGSIGNSATDYPDENVTSERNLEISTDGFRQTTDENYNDGESSYARYSSENEFNYSNGLTLSQSWYDPENDETTTSSLNITNNKDGETYIEMTDVDENTIVLKTTGITYNGDDASWDDIMAGGGGSGVTPSDVQDMIDESISGKVDTSAITTSITSGSTDSEIPTAKATYDAIQAGGGGGATYSAGTNISIDTGNTINCTLNLANGTGNLSLKGGDGCTASGLESFASGYQTIADREGSVAFGKHNVSNSTGSNYFNGNNNNYLFTVGNGYSGGYRHNALEIRQSGNIYFADTDNTTYSNYYEKPMVRLQDMYAALGGLKFVKLTQSEYDNLATKDSSTLYIISD